MRTIIRLIRWLLSRLHRKHAAGARQGYQDGQFVLERYFRRHMAQATKGNRRGRRARSRMVRMVHAKGLDR